MNLTRKIVDFSMIFVSYLLFFFFFWGAEGILIIVLLLLLTSAYISKEWKQSCFESQKQVQLAPFNILFAINVMNNEVLSLFFFSFSLPFSFCSFQTYTEELFLLYSLYQPRSCLWMCGPVGFYSVVVGGGRI